MPTGYTAAMLDGLTFQEYALSCARNFGALIEMRDEPMNTPIPDKFYPSDYSKKRLQEAKEEFARLNDMTKVAWQKELDKYFNTQVADFWDGKKKNAEAKAKYEAMLKQARAYKPPTPEHLNFAQFLVSQITETIDFDCKYWDKKQEPTKPLLESFITDTLKHAQDNIIYYNKSHSEELVRTESRNEWIRALKESLN